MAFGFLGTPMRALLGPMGTQAPMAGGVFGGMGLSPFIGPALARAQAMGTATGKKRKKNGTNTFLTPQTMARLQGGGMGGAY